MSGRLQRHPRFEPRGDDLYVEVEHRAGKLFAAFSDRGVSLVQPADDAFAFEIAFHMRFGREIAPAEAGEHDEVAQALIDGDTDSLDCDLDGVSNFTRRVLDAAKEIPRGETRSYQWLALRVGMPRAARAVGNALGANPVPILIPCHRIVRGDGSIGGYGYGQAMKRALLEAEGVTEFAAA